MASEGEENSKQMMTQASGRGSSILIVGLKKKLAWKLGEIIGGADNQVEIVREQEEGVRAIKTSHPDLVFLEFLADMDKSVRHLLKRRRIPYILVMEESDPHLMLSETMDRLCCGCIEQKTIEPVYIKSLVSHVRRSATGALAGS